MQNEQAQVFCPRLVGKTAPVTPHVTEHPEAQHSRCTYLLVTAPPPRKVSSNSRTQLPQPVLGQRHAGSGVRPESYATVGAALLWTLEQGLGVKFTPQVRAAWTAAYALLSGLMLEGVPRNASSPGHVAGATFRSWVRRVLKLSLNGNLNRALVTCHLVQSGASYDGWNPRGQSSNQ
jgi:hypothetical protein